MKNTFKLSPISVAPMMGYTNTYFRRFFRGISKYTLLYTEMYSSTAILHQNPKNFLSYSLEEKPLILQVAGSQPKDLSLCAKLAEDLGFDGININLGCPSSRAQEANFGACLMRQPKLVGECITEMTNAVKIPVSAKHRLGLGYDTRYEDLEKFIQILSQTPCAQYTIHARSAILSSLSPKKNRQIPSIHYDWVEKIAKANPSLSFEINGGIKDFSQAKAFLQGPIQSVMIGRTAIQNPYLFSKADSLFFDSQAKVPSREEILEHLEGLVKDSQNPKEKKRFYVASINLFRGEVGARQWRQKISSLSF